MRKTVVYCDRCGESPAPVKLKIRHTLFEICAPCEREVRALLRSPRARLGLNGHVAEVAAIGAIENQLADVRALAAEGLEGWASGATLDDLAQVLRDVATGARRSHEPERVN